MIVEFVGVGAAVTAAAVCGYAIGNRPQNGCNGHHWGDEKGVTDVSSATLDKAGFDKTDPKVYRIEQEYGHIYLYEYRVRRCTDCGKIEQTKTMIGDMTITELKEELQDQSQHYCTRSSGVSHC